ncbi:MAG: PaaI family thioesterase [Propionibacteriaceae bacterium]|jgi:uncharacterized protein (TIGR00369 family)|nr:PaaI family thioesterase [Propionibacteriaceae bacterium]
MTADLAADSELDSKLGLELIEVSAVKSVGRYPVAGNTQPAGLWHGGASGVAVETMASLCALAEVGDGGKAVGVELNVSHLQPADSGWVVATAEALRIGRSLASYEVRLTNGDTLIGVGRVTLRLIRAES